MLAKAKEVNPKTSIALQNGGGIRATIPAGDGFKQLEKAYKEGRVSEPGFVDYETSLTM